MALIHAQSINQSQLRKKGTRVPEMSLLEQRQWCQWELRYLPSLGRLLSLIWDVPLYSVTSSVCGVPTHSQKSSSDLDEIRNRVRMTKIISTSSAESFSSCGNGKTLFILKTKIKIKTLRAKAAFFSLSTSLYVERQSSCGNFHGWPNTGWDGIFWSWILLWIVHILLMQLYLETKLLKW